MERSMKVIGFVLAVCAWPCLAGNVYRCPDGSFQDKPCGGGGVVVAKNKPPAQVGGDKVCSDAAQWAEQIAKQKAQGVKLEVLLDDIDTHSDSYEKKLAEKKFTVDAYKFESPAEAKVSVEAQCVTNRSIAAAAAAGVTAQRVEANAGSVAVRSAPAVDSAAERTARDQKCAQYKEELTSVQEQQRGHNSPSGMESLSKKRRGLEKKLWDLCG
jgi:hypothetical protein